MADPAIWRRYLRFLGADVGADLDEELRFHLEMRAEALIAQGMEPERAYEEAVRRMGNLRRIRETCMEIGERSERAKRRRDHLTFTLMEVRRAARGLMRTPGFSLVAIVTLALGIGATTAIFTVLNAVVLNPLSFPASERLIRLKSAVPGNNPGEEWDLSPAEYFHFRENARTIEEFGAYRTSGANVQARDGAFRVRMALVTPGTLRMIGARTVLGRPLGAADDRPDAAPVVVLADAFWRREFGSDPSVVGRTLEVGGMPYEIVGVMESGAEMPHEPGAPREQRQPDLWRMLPLNPAGPFYNEHYLTMIARLREGVTLEQAQSEFDGLTRELPEAYPTVYDAGFFERYGFRTKLYLLRDYIVGDVARNLWVLFGGVGLVLLIACANVANLFLVRVEGRRRELAVRSALGAGRWAIARQFLAESLVLALLGAAIGLLLAYAGTRSLLALAPTTIPRLDTVSLDGTTLLFTVGVAFAVSIVLALFPLIRHGRPLGITALSDGARGSTSGRERQRVRAGLVVAQVGLALVLLVGAGLLIESFRRLRAVEPGIDPEGVVTMELYLAGERYGDVPAMWRFYSEVLDRVRALPGVEAAGMSETLPFTGAFGCTVQGFEDPDVFTRLAELDLTSCAGQKPTSPGYFEAMGIPLLRGRTFTRSDNDNPETGAVIVSEAFAERFWPGEDPIGKGINPNGVTNPPFYQVIGVVGDVYGGSVEEEPAIAVYYPLMRIPETPGWWPSQMSLVVKVGSGDPMALVPAVQRAVREADPAIPVANVEEMRDIMARSTSRTSFTMLNLGVAAAVALLLAAIGLYGVISYIVTRRTNEIGVRIALGARPDQVERLVVRGSMTMAAVGLLLGAAASLALSRLLRGFLYGVEVTSPTVYVAAIALLGGVAVLASWLPARRAARVDPATALRVE